MIVWDKKIYFQFLKSVNIYDDDEMICSIPGQPNSKVEEVTIR